MNDIAVKERVTEKTQLKQPSRYNIWALDNDITSFQEVVWILVRAFNMSDSVAAELTRKVDQEGKAKVNSKPLSKGIAEAQLNKVNNIKRSLAGYIPMRSKQIMALKFVIKED